MYINFKYTLTNESTGVETLSIASLCVHCF